MLTSFDSLLNLIINNLERCVVSFGTDLERSVFSCLFFLAPFFCRCCAAFPHLAVSCKNKTGTGIPKAFCRHRHKKKTTVASQTRRSSLSLTKTPTQNPPPLTSAAIFSRPFQPQHCKHGQVRGRGQAGPPRGCDLAKGRTPIPQGHQGVPRGLGPVPARQGAHHRLASKVQPAMAHQRRHRRPHAGSDVDPPGSGLRQDCRDPRRVRVDVVVAAGEHLCHYGNHKG